MVILRGSMLDRREDGSSCRARAGRWLCGGPPAAVGSGPGARRRRRGPEGLRAARGARRANNSPGERRPAAGRELRRIAVSACVARRRSDPSC
jgi:hypothetical protein